MKATDIKWDTDSDFEILCMLPKEVEIPESMKDVDIISEWLTEKVGFCHSGFVLVE